MRLLIKALYLKNKCPELSSFLFFIFLFLIKSLVFPFRHLMRPCKAIRTLSGSVSVPMPTYFSKTTAVSLHGPHRNIHSVQFKIPFDPKGKISCCSCHRDMLFKDEVFEDSNNCMVFERYHSCSCP